MKKVRQLVNPVLIIFIATVLRLIPHMPNFAPITAMALFGGVYVNKRYAIIVPLLTMLISDYLLLYINPYGIHHFPVSHVYSPLALWYNETIVAVYGSFLISGLLGIWLRTHKTVQNVFFVSLIASVQFFLITNAAVWLSGMYDRSLLGLWESYLAGIPFFRWTVTGDLFYTGVFFGGFELAVRIIKPTKSVYAT